MSQTNEYGLNVDYQRKKLTKILTELPHYTPDELARSLCRLAVVAEPSVLAEAEFSSAIPSDMSST